MPIMILIPAITISSAISVYWVVSNAFQVLQTLLLQNPFKYKKQQQEKLQREKQRQKALRKAKKRAFKKRETNFIGEMICYDTISRKYD